MTTTLELWKMIFLSSLIHWFNPITGSRRIWIMPDSCVRGLHSFANVSRTFQHSFQSIGINSFIRCISGWYNINHHRKSIAVDWAILLSLGSIICEKSHSNYCFSIGTSANVLVFILLRLTGMYLNPCSGSQNVALMMKDKWSSSIRCFFFLNQNMCRVGWVSREFPSAVVQWVCALWSLINNYLIHFSYLDYYSSPARSFKMFLKITSIIFSCRYWCSCSRRGSISVSQNSPTQTFSSSCMVLQAFTLP